MKLHQALRGLCSPGATSPSSCGVYVEDDDRGDPLITEDALVALDIASPEDIDYMKETARKATDLITDYLAQRGLELIDIKCGSESSTARL